MRSEVARLRARRCPENPRLEPAVLAELAAQVTDFLRRARAHVRLQPRMPGAPMLIHRPFAA
eukprot:622209-Prorocentrum_lima.AAC.1